MFNRRFSLKIKRNYNTLHKQPRELFEFSLNTSKMCSTLWNLKSNQCGYICHSSEVRSSSNQKEIMSSYKVGGGGSNFHDFRQRKEVGVKYLPVVQQLAIWRIYFEI